MLRRRCQEIDRRRMEVLRQPHGRVDERVPEPLPLPRRCDRHGAQERALGIDFEGGAADDLTLLACHEGGREMIAKARERKLMLAQQAGYIRCVFGPRAIDVARHGHRPPSRWRADSRGRVVSAGAVNSPSS